MGVEGLVQHSLGPGPFEIELDVSAGQMHWARFGSDAIKRANLCGSNVETLYRPPHHPMGDCPTASRGQNVPDGVLEWDLRPRVCDSSGHS